MSNLHVHSDYSVRDSIQSVSKIIQYQLDHGKHWFAITDHGTFSAHNEAFELVEKMRKEGTDISFYPGVEFYLKPDPEDDGKLNVAKIAELNNVLKRKTEDYPGQKDNAKAELDSIMSNPMHNLSYYHITALAYNQQGLQNLYNINNNGELYYKHRVFMDDLIRYNEGLVVLTGCPAGYLYANIENGKPAKAEKWLRSMKKVFGDRLYVEIQFHNGIAELKREENESDNDYYNRREQYELNVYRKIIKLAREVDVKLVGTNDSHYTYPKDRRWWEITRKAMLSNAKYDLSVGDYSMQENNAMFEEVYAGLLTAEELDESENEIVSRLDKNIKLPHSVYKSEHSDRAALERMVWTGFKNKRLGTPEEEKSLLQIPYELAVIQTKGFDKYFLMVKKMIRAAYDRGVLIGPGRGSGAGSEVTYMCDITKVDPIKYGLMFERFLNSGREAMPDIDSDLESTACKTFEPSEEFYRDIDNMFARETASDDEIESYWERWRALHKERGDFRRERIFEDYLSKFPNAKYFDGPVWNQTEDIIIVKER